MTDFDWLAYRASEQWNEAMIAAFFAGREFVLLDRRP